jgi:hypothetical protein
VFCFSSSSSSSFFPLFTQRVGLCFLILGFYCFIVFYASGPNSFGLDSLSGVFVVSVFFNLAVGWFVFSAFLTITIWCRSFFPQEACGLRSFAVVLVLVGIDHFLVLSRNVLLGFVTFL